jgi:hypothetical protein
MRSLGIEDIVPEALHQMVGLDWRHHFMAEKIVDRFALMLPRDRELVRQLAVIYVLRGLKRPPEEGNSLWIETLSRSANLSLKPEKKGPNTYRKCL